MNTQFFLLAPGTQPSARWFEAFPDGRCRERAALMADARPGDVIWLETAPIGWEDTLVSLRAALPACPVAMLTYLPDSREATRAFERGARGYCHALAVPALLREVGLVVAHGGLWVGPELMARLVGAARRGLDAGDDASTWPSVLSAREREVAQAVAAGMANKEIAAMLGITERTVKAHLSAIFEKLEVRDRLQLVLRMSARTAVLDVD